MSRIAISGSYSTGKTTLFERLKPLLPHYEFLSETARTVIETKGINPSKIHDDLEAVTNFQKMILESQIDLENKFENFIVDRSIFDCIAFCGRLDKKIRDAYEDRAFQHYQKNSYDLVFFLPMTLELEADGTRVEDKKFQQEVNDKILELFNKYGVNYQIMDTDVLEERIQFLLQKIKEI